MRVQNTARATYGPDCGVADIPVCSIHASAQDATCYVDSRQTPPGCSRRGDEDACWNAPSARQQCPCRLALMTLKEGSALSAGVRDRIRQVRPNHATGALRARS